MSFTSRPVALSAVAVCALTVNACAAIPNGNQDGSSSVQSTMAASTADELRSDTSSAQAGITPLGDANTSQKTQRPPAPAQLLVTDVRVGKHDGFERVVFELEGDGTPGWFIDYTDQPTQQGSGNRIDYKGSTALNVNIDGTAYPFELGTEDPNLGTTAGTGGFVTEVISVGTFEGRSQFVIGMTEEHPYSVQILRGPTRVVIDIIQGS